MTEKQPNQINGGLNRLTIFFWITILITCLVAATYIVLSLDESDITPTVSIDFSRRLGTLEEPGLHGSDHALELAIAGIISPYGTVRSYRGLLDYLQTKLGIPVNLKQRKSYQEVNDLLENGGLDAALICSGGYVHARRSSSIEILAVPMIRGKATYQAYIIVHRNSGIRDFSGLGGHSFAFTDPLSNTGWLFPVSRLSAMGKTPNSFFSRVVYTYGHDRSIEEVAQKMVDGASIDSVIYDDFLETAPEKLSQIQIIERSPYFAAPPFVASSKLDYQKKSKLKMVLLTMHQNEQGVEVLRSLGITRFVEGNDQAYDSISEMAKRVGFWRP